MRNLFITLLFLAMILVVVENQVNKPEQPPAPEVVAAARQRQAVVMIPVLLVVAGTTGFLLWLSRGAWSKGEEDVPAEMEAWQAGELQATAVGHQARATEVTLNPERFR